jgi:L-lactate dehydrogenase complex protein LldG
MSTTFEAFKTRAEGVSAEVHRFKTCEDGLAFILGFLRDAGVSDVPECGAVWAAGTFIDGAVKDDLKVKVPGICFEPTQAASAASKVGISQLDWAISATGTLVQDASAVDKRLVSTLPPIHMAVIGTDRILADMGSVLEKLRPQQLNYISFITGPSRTADIERVLTIGVHGPERLIIVVVDELQQVTA